MYALARWVWNIARWVCLTLVVPVVADLFKSALSAKKPGDILPNSFLFGSDYRILTLSVLGVLFVITLAARIVVAIEDRGKGGKALREYLRAVVNNNTGLSPTGIYQQSQALISVNVPLDDNFIHLLAVADRPRYDIPQEQLRLLEQLRQRSDLTIEEREEQIQRLRGVWWQELSVSQKLEVRIEEVLQRLTAKNPVAVILGAPGSGKSTTMRWQALHMARASLSMRYHLPNGLSMRQIPILLQIGDYAKCFTGGDDQPFEQFLSDRCKEIHSDLPTRLMDELAKGHCMLLFDGLDEVANDELRRRVAKAIQVFIARYTPEDPDAKHYNRFIVTSRIAGYEEGPFSSYTHYTLQELTDKQIEDFLTTWCPAVERHMARSAERSKELTAQQRVQADRAGEEQRDRLVETLKTNTGIRRLAANPLMLTILALIQRSGKTLPHRRIDLYQVVTRTLLDNWNQGTGRETLIVKLAEQALSNLAYHLPSSDRLITEREVEEIVRRSMTTFYERPLDQHDDAIIDTFIETIRRTSGLFVESGQGLFSFMHRTFQEYFVAQYLLMPVELQVTPNELQQFVVRQCRSATWREPLLLAIADRSGQDKQATSRLIQVILDTNDSYDAFLYRNLLFAAPSMGDCEAWSITAALQQRVANQFFDLYGDSFDTGRYTALQKEIEEVALLWLRGQPQEGARTPLLEAWSSAFCDSNHPLRQEGATHLLASIAPDLSSCPRSVLHALVPPLLQLAGIQDWYRHDLFCPGEIRSQLPQAAARPTSLSVEEYAFITLRLLDAAGPAGWLRTAWLKWNEEQSALLERLTQHSLELDYPLTPAAVPGERDDPNWDTQSKIYAKWQELARRNPRALQVQLLQASDAARFPHAYLFKRVLDREIDASSPISWLATWDSVLQQEMAHGRSATYQACLNLRLLLCRGNEQQRQEIANELMAALVTQVEPH